MPGFLRLAGLEVAARNGAIPRCDLYRKRHTGGQEMALAWRLVRAEGVEGSVHSKLDSAVYFIRAGMLDDAVRVVDEVLSGDETDVGLVGRAHSFKGEIASIRGDLDETVREYAL